MDRALTIVAHLGAAIPSAIWLWLPSARPRTGSVAVAGIISLVAYLFALSNYELINYWHETVGLALVHIAPKFLAVAYSNIANPVASLSAIWLLTYVATLQIGMLLQRKREVKDYGNRNMV